MNHSPYMGVDYETLALAERLRSDWIAQSTARCLADPAYALTAIDVERNPGPTLADALAISHSTRTLH